MKLLKTLCEIQAPSGDEILMKFFLLNYIEDSKSNWKVEPEVLYGSEFQNCIVLVFGTPKTAVFAHMDSIGFTVRYEDQLVPIGSPKVTDGCKLVGKDSSGPIKCTLSVREDNSVSYNFTRVIDTGTSLLFKPNFRESKDFVQCCYLDNRIGIYVALKLAREVENGILVFSCWEEHGGGSIPYLIRFVYEKYQIHQALICDITWVTDGIRHGKGTVISIRDKNIPRRQYLERIISFAQGKNIDYQLEVEATGSSDGREIQNSPYPIDWCFIGAPEDNVHTPDEKVHKNDIYTMIELYKVLLEDL